MMDDTRAPVRDVAVDEKLASVSFHPDATPHITLDVARCQQCTIERVCCAVCPAQNYRWDALAHRVVVNTESCFECGTCRIACTDGAITWRWPGGGAGVAYRWG